MFKLFKEQELIYPSKLYLSVESKEFIENVY